MRGSNDIQADETGVLLDLEDRLHLVLAFARVLFVNGQSTDKMVEACDRLGHFLGLTATLIPRWGMLQLNAVAGGATRLSVIEAAPTGVDMDRVACAMEAIDALGTGRLTPTAAFKTIEAIARQPAAKRRAASQHVAC